MTKYPIFYYILTPAPLELQDMGAEILLEHNFL
jgi:hypothetical protein